MNDGGDFDASVAREWQSFGQRLAAYVSMMREGDVLSISAETSGARLTRGHVQLRPVPGSRVVLGLSDHPIERGPDPGDVTGARGGSTWRHETSADGQDVAWLSVDAGQATHLTEVALEIVAAAAISPEFVRVTATGPHAQTLTDAQDDVVHEPRARTRASSATRDEDSLTVKVVKTVARLLDSKPRVDAHGDLVIEGWESPVYVRVTSARATLEKCERVTVFTHLPLFLGTAPDVARHVADVDAGLGDLSVRVEGDTCVLSADVPTEPFEADRLTDAISRVGTSIMDVVTRVGDRLAGGGTGRPTPPELLCLIEIVADGGAPLRPDEVAHVCGHDREQILCYLQACTRGCRSAASEASAAREAGDVSLADELDAETAAWHELRTRLREALRLVMMPGERTEPRT